MNNDKNVTVTITLRVHGKAEGLNLLQLLDKISGFALWDANVNASLCGLLQSASFVGGSVIHDN